MREQPRSPSTRARRSRCTRAPQTIRSPRSSSSSWTCRSSPPATSRRAEATDVLRTTGCAAVMVGRAAQGNPWAIGEIAGQLDGEPSREEVVAELVVFIRDTVLELGEERATGFLKKFYGWYLGRGRFPSRSSRSSSAWRPSPTSSGGCWQRHPAHTTCLHGWRPRRRRRTTSSSTSLSLFTPAGN